MPTWKTGLAVLSLLASLSGLASAQMPDMGGATASYPTSQTPGNLDAFYGNTPNFANYGLSGSYPSYGGYGYPAYGPGAQFGAHYPVSPGPKVPASPKKPAGSRVVAPKAIGKPAPAGYGSTRASMPTRNKL